MAVLGKVGTGLGIARELAMRLKGAYPDVADTQASLEVLTSEEVSVSRYGDGEFDLIAGKPLKFQPFDRRLQRRLATILGARENSSCRVAIPYALRSVRGLTLKSAKFWLYHCNSARETVYPLLNSDYRYLDAQVSRFYINRRSKALSSGYLAAWKSLWDGKDILVAEGAGTRFGAGDGLLDGAASIKRVICPSTNAWASYADILATVLRHSGSCDLVLLALGPTATVLAYDLSLNGVRAIDSGNLDMECEWMRRGSKSQVAVEGKYTHEARGGTFVSAFGDSRYERQIVETIE